MEALYAKLYDKYTTLKKRKFSELDEVHKEQEEKFLNFVKASEALNEHLRSENQSLKEALEELRNENTEIRCTKDEERFESRKCLLEEERKNKALSKEVEKLKEVISKGGPHNYEDQSGRNRDTESPQVTTRGMGRRSKQTEDMVEKDTVSPTRSVRRRSKQTEDMVQMDMVSPTRSIRHKSTTETLLVSPPKCCRTTEDGSSTSAGCPFQALSEHLIGMKLSTSNEGGESCIIASHQSTGLSFSLTLVKNSTGGEAELLYKVVSLGTLARVAPEWMKEVIKFRTSMSPIFFERVSRVIKPQA